MAKKARTTAARKKVSKKAAGRRAKKAPAKKASRKKASGKGATRKPAASRKTAKKSSTRGSKASTRKRGKPQLVKNARKILEAEIERAGGDLDDLSWRRALAGYKKFALIPFDCEEEPVADPFPAARITGWEPIDDYPHWDERDLGIETEDDPNASRAILTASGDKLLGWPFWVQAPAYPRCSSCRSDMTPLFQVDHIGHLPFGFGDAGCGHVFVCPGGCSASFSYDSC